MTTINTSQQISLTAKWVTENAEDVTPAIMARIAGPLNWRSSDPEIVVIVRPEQAGVTDTLAKAGGKIGTATITLNARMMPADGIPRPAPGADIAVISIEVIEPPVHCVIVPGVPEPIQT